MDFPTRNSRQRSANRAIFAIIACALVLLWGQRPALAQQGAISGMVFADVNGDGVRQPEEAGIANVSLTFSGVGEPVQGVTNDDGNYFFTATVGEWTINVTPPPGFEAVNGPSRNVLLAAEEQSIVLDFGLRAVQMTTDTPPPDPQPGPTDTPGILPTTGAPAAPSLLPLLALAILAALGAGLFLSALRGRRPKP